MADTLGGRINFPGAKQTEMTPEELAEQQRMSRLAALQKIADANKPQQPMAQAPSGEELSEDEIIRKNKEYLAKKYGKPIS